METRISLKTILLITHVIPYPPSAGNEIRILNLLKWFKSEGYQTVLLLKVDFLESHILSGLKNIVDAVYLLGYDSKKDNVLLNKNAKQKLIELLRQQIKRIIKSTIASIQLFFHLNTQNNNLNDSFKHSFCPNALTEATQQLCLKYNPSVVVAEYIFTSPCLDVVPQHTLKIIDTIDMFSRKQENVIKYNIKELLACTPHEERNYLLKCDLIIAIQTNEARLFRQLVPEKEVLTVGIDYDVINEIDNSNVIADTVLIVGSDNPLNIHGLTEFYKNAWPLISKENPKAILRVIGKIGRYLQVDDEKVQTVGWVKNLDYEYRKATVVINPTIAGTGLKIKSVEALCQAKPLVAWPNGIEGLEFTGEAPFVVCNSWLGFAEAVLLLLKFEDKRVKLQYQALRFSKQNFSSSKVYSALAQKLQQL